MPEAGKLLVRPDTPGPYPAMLLLPALGAPSVDHLDAPAKHLMSVLAQGGIASLRVDPPPARGVADLLESYRAHADALAAEPDVSSVFLFGHSLGGVLAPLVARDMPLGGVAVYGAPSKRWCEALSEGARRQLALAGLPLEDVEREA
ncbi:MAG TPA: hypothetical protein VFB62_19840, partial [Polyangiaceae bacterium]|nr:hypothetical protein [Polyangiaceae bacterium]